MKMRFHGFFLSTAFAILPGLASGAQYQVPRVLPPGVFLKSAATTDNNRVKCVFTDGITYEVKDRSDCFKTAVAQAAKSEKPQALPANTTPLRPIASTRTLPPYPRTSVEMNEQGTTLAEVHITTKGDVDRCIIVSSSSSQTLDETFCEHVQKYWRWQSPTSQGQPIAVSTRVSMKWELKEAPEPALENKSNFSSSNNSSSQVAPWAHSPRVMPRGVSLKSATTTPNSRIKCTFSDGVVHEVQNRNDCFKTADTQFGSVTQQPQKSLADFKEQCIAYGYKSGTPAAAECVMKLDLAQQQENRLSAEREMSRRNSANLAQAEAELRRKQIEAAEASAEDSRRRTEAMVQQMKEARDRQSRRSSSCSYEMGRVLLMPMTGAQQSDRYSLAARARRNCEEGLPPPAELTAPPPTYGPGHMTCKPSAFGDRLNCSPGY